MEVTYDSYFAAKLVLDLTSLDRAGRVLLNELEEVFDTHVGNVSHSTMCEEVQRLGTLCVWRLRTGNSWRLVRKEAIPHGLRHVENACRDYAQSRLQSAGTVHPPHFTVKSTFNVNSAHRAFKRLVICITGKVSEHYY